MLGRRNIGSMRGGGTYTCNQACGYTCKNKGVLH
jgi:hypothetical protein